MSIILDALKKSERERQAGQVPGISQVVTETGAARPRWLPWVIGLLAVMNAGGIGFWLYRDHASKAPIPPQSMVAPADLGTPAREVPAQTPASVPLAGV